MMFNPECPKCGGSGGTSCGCSQDTDDHGDCEECDGDEHVEEYCDECKGTGEAPEEEEDEKE